MRRILTSILCSLFFKLALLAQVSNEIKGSVFTSDTKIPLANVSVALRNTSMFATSNRDGFFILKNIPAGEQLLDISIDNFKPHQLKITLESDSKIELGTIFLDRDLSKIEQEIGLISLTEDDLNTDDVNAENTAGFLQASRDVFQRRAAFDFGQAYFRSRGYDSQYGVVLINGLSTNRLLNGRPQWNNWGGLNDIMRNQEHSRGLSASNHSFGDVLGSTNITTRASLFRPGMRVSSSFSNKTYIGRVMATFSSGLQQNGMAYTISASRRWGNEGFIDGSFYDAFSLFGAIEYKFNLKNGININAFYAPNKRGSGAPITQRVYDELGRKYNPYWGYQEDVKRNSRARTIEEPLFMISYFYEGDKTAFTTTISYQNGLQARSRLDFANAPNPNPNYWRYLSSIAKKPQIDWQALYDANRNGLNVENPGAARYILYEDRTADNLLAAASTFTTSLSNFLSIDTGGTFKRLQSENFAMPVDLLGASYYLDVNQFSIINGQPSRNDLNGDIEKNGETPIKYNYTMYAEQLSGFAQIRVHLKNVNFFIAGSYTATDYQREGHFLNQVYENNSLGLSEELKFSDLGYKGGVTYKISGRHLASINAGIMSKAPLIRNAFVNVRENNETVEALDSEKIISAEVNYLYRSPLLKARMTGYFTEFHDGTDLNFVFAQTGSGTDFFQEVITEIDKRHLGFEVGLEYQMSPTTKISFAGAYGQHTYTDAANVRINFDTEGFNDDVINTIGFKDLGPTNIKGLRVANGPQQAYSIGIEYRDPKYWWVGATANYLSDSYVDISTLARTDDFYLNPDEPLGLPSEDIDRTLAGELLKQEKFAPFYLLNLTGGKSWRIKRSYLSLFVSINNLFESEYKTGGFEQSRTANYADLIEDTANGITQRNFGNKYWFGFGRTYFINLAYNF